MITYNDFEKYLTKIQKIHELEDEIRKKLGAIGYDI